MARQIKDVIADECVADVGLAGQSMKESFVFAGVWQEIRCAGLNGAVPSY